MSVQTFYTNHLVEMLNKFTNLSKLLCHPRVQ